MNDQEYTNDDLIHAVSVFVDSMDTETLRMFVSDDIFLYYKKNATLDEVLEFIGENTTEEIAQ